MIIMVRKHISRDFSAHNKSVIRPRDEYAKIEIFSYDPVYDKEYYYGKNISEKLCENIKKVSWRSWSAYASKDESNPFTITIKYNVSEIGDYRIDYLYEQSSYLHTTQKNNNTDKDLVGEYTLSQNGAVISTGKPKFDGENQVLKRSQIFAHLQTGEVVLNLEIPHNCYFYGMIIRKIKKFVGLNDYSGESLIDGNLMFLDATLTHSNMTKPSELQFNIGYDSSYVCNDKPSGFYMDYRDEVNYYIKDNDGKIQNVFGGYISSILPNDDLSKITIHCADRLVDGQDKYCLEELVMQDGTKKLSENDYNDGMEKSFSSYAEVLKFLCESHETTLSSNISKNYTVDGEKFHDGKIITFGSSNNVKKITPTNGTATSAKKFITLRNNEDGSKKQSFPLWDAKSYGKTPVKITNYPYFHITYGLGDPKTESKQNVTEYTDTSDTNAGSQKFGKCGQSSDKKYVMGIGKTSGSKSKAKAQGLSTGVYYKTIFKNKCPFCGKATLRWDSCRSDTKCIYTQNWKGTKRKWGVASSETEITCNNCDADFDPCTGYEKMPSPKKHLTKAKKSVKSSKSEQDKLHKGKMTDVADSNVELTPDDIFKSITKIAFKYKYKRGSSSTYSAMKKSGSGDCWAFSDLIFKELQKYGISCKIVEYSTNASRVHRSVLYKNKKGKWTDFPYREYNWNTHFHNMLNNTSKSLSASYVDIYKGNNMGNVKNPSTSTSQKTTTTITTTKGYDTSNLFQGYIKLVYSLENKFSATKYNLYLNFTQTANSNHAVNGLSPVWVNNQTRKSTLNVNLTDFIRQIRGDKKEIYLQSISIETPVKPQKENSTSNDPNWYKVDNQNIDESSCKMDLYQIVFDDKNSPNPSELNSCGKTVNSLIQDVVNDAGYLVEMTFGEHRKDDKINFRVPNQNSTVFTASEGDDNNILNWNSINYNPISTLYNTSIQVYKGVDEKYYYVDTHDTSSILSYGEHTTLSTVNEVTGSKEAYFNAVHNDKYNPSHTYSYTIITPNYPNVRIGDWVKVVANAKKLNTIKEIKSIKIVYNNSKSPRIRTELGLDELAPDIQVKENIRKLRVNAKNESTWFSSSAIPISEETIYEWDK